MKVFSLSSKSVASIFIAVVFAITVFSVSCKTVEPGYEQPAASLTTDQNATEVRDLVSKVGSESLSGIRSLVVASAAEPIVIERIDDALEVNRSLVSNPLHYTTNDNSPATYALSQILSADVTNKVETQTSNTKNYKSYVWVSVASCITLAVIIFRKKILTSFKRLLAKVKNL